jgi:hypothetical protein
LDSTPVVCSVASSRRVTACTVPTFQPGAAWPVIFAAPRMCVAVGASVNSASGVPPCGPRPMRRE